MAISDSEILSRFRNVRNFVLTGEAGSGKTEIAINLARLLREQGGRTVRLFDMDQTKPLLRARDAAAALEGTGVELHFQPQLLDTPLVPSGVIESILDKDCDTVLDVGGNEQGARMMGQFSMALTAASSVALFVANPYRPWSRDPAGIEATIEKISRASRFENIRIVSNPNLGEDTTAEEVIAGHEKLLRLLGDREPEFLCVLERLREPVEAALRIPVLPVRRSILYSWQES